MLSAGFGPVDGLFSPQIPPHPAPCVSEQVLSRAQPSLFFLCPHLLLVRQRQTGGFNSWLCHLLGDLDLGEPSLSSSLKQVITSACSEDLMMSCRLSAWHFLDAEYNLGIQALELGVLGREKCVGPALLPFSHPLEDERTAPIALPFNSHVISHSL